MSHDGGGHGEAGTAERAGGGDGPGDRMDRYLDGLMSMDEASAFEAEAERDGALRDEIALQRRIDAGLRRAFEPPVGLGVARGARAGSGVEAGAAEGAAGALEGVAGRIQPTGRAGGGRRSPWRAWAAAAALVLMGGGGAYWWFVIGSPAPFRQPAEIYQVQVVRGYVPQWACETDEEFERAVRERFDEPALLPLSTPGVEIVGWAYGTPVLSNKTATLLTRVEGREVLVLIDRAERDVNLRRAGETIGLAPVRLFRRRLGGLVLYEVTPLDVARVIPAFVAGE